MVTMSLSIEHIILHSLRLNGEGTLVADTRQAELPRNPAVIGMAEELHRIYQQKGNKSYACFSDEVETAGQDRFRDLLDEFIKGRLPFVEFSIRATELLLAQLTHHGLPNEGALVFCEYHYVGSHYILLGLLDCEHSVTLTDSLELTQVRYLDLNKMQLVARMDVTDYQRNPDSNRYLSFIKGRAGRKVSDFFLEFLGAREGLDQRLQNSVLIQAVKDYCNEAALPAETQVESRKRIQAYCSEQLREGEDIALREVAECLPPRADGDFYSFVGEEYGLEESFPPSRTALRALTKYVGSGGGLNLSFDEALLGSRIQYDAATDTLTIQGTPPNLRDQLQRSRNQG